MKIIGIGGSLRPDSQTYAALKIALRLVEEMHGSSELIDLREMHLPFCDGGQDYPGYPDVAKLRDKMKTANGVIVATPEYHGSVSGVLKNALDLLDETHVEGKVFLLIGVLGGEHSTNAVNSLRTICRHLHAWVIPDQVVIPNAARAFDSAGDLVDPAIHKRLHSCVQSLIANTHKLTRE